MKWVNCVSDGSCFVQHNLSNNGGSTSEKEIKNDEPALLWMKQKELKMNYIALVSTMP